MTEFVIVNHSDPNQVAIEVQRLLRNGWEFHGQMFTIAGTFEGVFGTRICQAMVRDSQKQK